MIILKGCVVGPFVRIPYTLRVMDASLACNAFYIERWKGPARQTASDPKESPCLALPSRLFLIDILI